MWFFLARHIALTPDEGTWNLMEQDPTCQPLLCHYMENLRQTSSWYDELSAVEADNLLAPLAEENSWEGIMGVLLPIGTLSMRYGKAPIEPNHIGLTAQSLFFSEESCRRKQTDTRTFSNCSTSVQSFPKLSPASPNKTSSAQTHHLQNSYQIITIINIKFLRRGSNKIQKH